MTEVTLRIFFVIENIAAKVFLKASLSVLGQNVDHQSAVSILIFYRVKVVVIEFFKGFLWVCVRAFVVVCKEFFKRRLVSLSKDYQLGELVAACGI